MVPHRSRCSLNRVKEERYTIVSMHIDQVDASDIHAAALLFFQLTPVLFSNRSFDSPDAIATPRSTGKRTDLQGWHKLRQGDQEEVQVQKELELKVR